MRLHSISREDILIKLKMCQAENTLLRKQIVEDGKDKAFIHELQHKIEVLEMKLKANK